MAAFLEGDQNGCRCDAWKVTLPSGEVEVVKGVFPWYYGAADRTVVRLTKDPLKMSVPRALEEMWLPYRTNHFSTMRRPSSYEQREREIYYWELQREADDGRVSSRLLIDGRVLTFYEDDTAVVRDRNSPDSALRISTENLCYSDSDKMKDFIHLFNELRAAERQVRVRREATSLLMQVQCPETDEWLDVHAMSTTIGGKQLYSFGDCNQGIGTVVRCSFSDTIAHWHGIFQFAANEADSSEAPSLSPLGDVTTYPVSTQMNMLLANLSKDAKSRLNDERGRAVMEQVNRVVLLGMELGKLSIKKDPVTSIVRTEHGSIYLRTERFSRRFKGLHEGRPGMGFSRIYPRENSVGLDHRIAIVFCGAVGGFSKRSASEWKIERKDGKLWFTTRGPYGDTVPLWYLDKGGSHVDFMESLECPEGYRALCAPYSPDPTEGQVMFEWRYNRRGHLKTHQGTRVVSGDADQSSDSGGALS